MRTICLSGALLVALFVFAQDGKRPILVSHDDVDGPFGGEHHVEDLQVFWDGRVLYAEEGTTTLGEKPARKSYETQLEASEIQELVRLLDSRETRFLPKKISPKTKPIDFFWQKSLEINRSDRAQRIVIENFYPFLNIHGHIYPQALIELECSLQDIKEKAAKRQHRPDESNWCKDLTQKHGS